MHDAWGLAFCHSLWISREDTFLGPQSELHCTRFLPHTHFFREVEPNFPHENRKRIISFDSDCWHVVLKKNRQHDVCYCGKRISERLVLMQSPTTEDTEPSGTRAPETLWHGLRKPLQA